ncbi:hypothetical protein CB3_031 [Pectobacterium phage vB_PatP_CB3]|uniref:Uncharacterized protein n=3 Tax=Cbunavirus TaxID=2842586 RepID=A0A2P0PBC8_9CAUD|nr:hypothetical protein HWB08_gp28 [Pectobacterium phage vB_PatP_CB1]YP_009832360.1 hypothetical protein HWB09_gp031 [Pectobacterium phage vB_PatP_CB4]AQT27873.1 hypothetical protein CB4_031 [Pectobacterium phage vB_PatP_CB4]ARB11755.1 hypothetical protein CB1_28 [Pectobacterium phage vB_PatP_CB1]ARB11855.1 hypothetical protein CB3_031 [Pectobacterium phage vB_PatP_CB3]
MSLSKDMDRKVRLALGQYSEWQVASMYNLRVGAVRAIKLEMDDEHRQFNARIQQDLFRQTFKLSGTVTGRIPSLVPEGLHNSPREYENHLPSLDYVGLEARVMAGFFTPTGLPTPAFWGFINQYVKKSGHTMLDILHDQEIYAPEQLERALDIDSQLEDMTPEQLASLLHRVSKKVYEHAIADPTGPGANVSDGE